MRVKRIERHGGSCDPELKPLNKKYIIKTFVETTVRCGMRSESIKY